MKHLPFLLLLVAAPAHALSHAEADTLVARAARAYSTGDHRTAMALYDSLAREYNSAALQLNIGNCWYKQGDIAHAILHYERGLRLAPGDADLQANLDLLNTQVKDRIITRPGLALGSTWQRIRGGSDPDQWARRSLWASLTLFALLAATVLIRQRGLRRAFMGISGVALLGLVLCVVFASMRHAELTDDSEAIIIAPKVDVLGEPRSGSTVLFVLHKGTKVVVMDVNDGWSEVQLPNGNVGWMPPLSVERI